MVVMTIGERHIKNLIGRIRDSGVDDIEAVTKLVNSVLKMSNLDSETVLDIVRLFFLLKEKEHHLSLFSVISCLSKLSETKDIREILVRDTPFMSSILELALDSNSGVRIWRKTSFMLAVLLKPDTLVLDRSYYQDEVNLQRTIDAIVRLLLTKDVFGEMVTTPLLSLSYLHENTNMSSYTVAKHFKVFEIHRDEIVGVPCILAKYKNMFGRVVTSPDEIGEEKLNKINSILSV